jgi:hypothetical protein
MGENSPNLVALHGMHERVPFLFHGNLWLFYIIETYGFSRPALFRIFRLILENFGGSSRTRLGRRKKRSHYATRRRAFVANAFLFYSKMAFLFYNKTAFLFYNKMAFLFYDEMSFSSFSLTFGELPLKPIRKAMCTGKENNVNESSFLQI